MAKFRPTFNTFVGGEISPLLHGGVNLQRYKDGANVIENKTVESEGGVKRRPGLRFIAEAKFSNKDTRLIPFEFSPANTYIIEAGDLYFRFFTLQARIESPPGTPVEIVTPYASTIVESVRFAQAADTLILVEGTVAPQQLVRTSDLIWTISEIEFTDGPYREENISATTLTLSGGPPWTKGSTLTLTASAAEFNTGHVGSLWRLADPADPTKTTYVKVTGFTSSTVLTVEAKRDVPAGLQNVATLLWREGAWSTFRGFPRVVTFHEQRSIFAGNASQPNVVWGSKSGSFFDFTPGVNDDDPFTFAIASPKLPFIQWIASGNKLFIGTATAEIWMEGGEVVGITPTNVFTRHETYHGGFFMEPVLAQGAILFLQRIGKKLLQWIFEQGTGAYSAPDLSITTSHFFCTGSVRLAYAQQPVSIVWIIRDDGMAIGLTYNRAEKVIAWHRHFTPSGLFKSVAVIPSSTITRGTGPVPFVSESKDEVWWVVKRQIAGLGIRQYIEMFDDALNVDSGLTLSVPTAVTSFTGLGHLEGATVSIVGDKHVYPTKVVTSGAVSVITPAFDTEIGLFYGSRVETVRPVADPTANTIQGQLKRWHEAIVRFTNTKGGRIQGEALPFPGRDGVGVVNQPDTAGENESEDVRVPNLGFEAGKRSPARICIDQDQPLPMSVLLVTGTLDLGEPD